REPPVPLAAGGVVEPGDDGLADAVVVGEQLLALPRAAEADELRRLERRDGLRLLGLLSRVEGGARGPRALDRPARERDDLEEPPRRRGERGEPRLEERADRQDRRA